MEGPAHDEAVLRAAHTVARGGDLDAKLDALAEEARCAAEAAASVIYVLDPLGGMLVPAATAGIELSALVEAGPVTLTDQSALVARVVLDRRPETTANGDAPASNDPLAAFASLHALPLVYTDETGGDAAEGALLVAHEVAAAERPAGTDEESLAAVADLCAVAIRQARLEQTLLERAEWLERMASSDPLTGLPNRATFERVLELEVARASRLQTGLTLLLFDVDGLSSINDELGAHVGDDVLRGTASLLAEQVRLVDTVARVGPDEFGLVAPGAGGAVLGRRIRDAAAAVRVGSGAQLSLSVGIAVFPDDGASTAELLAAAGQRLTEAQGRGGGSIAGAREPHL